MKKIFISIAGLLIISSVLISCGPSSDEAVKYYETLVNQQAKVFESESVLIEAISKNMSDKLDTSYNNLQSQLNESTKAIQKMDAFDGKTEMKDAMLRVFDVYKDAVENDYPEIINLAKTPDTLYTQETDDKVIEIWKNIDAKINKAIDDFVAKQEEFSEKYKFELPSQRKEKK